VCVRLCVLYFNEAGVNEDIEYNTLFVCSADLFFFLPLLQFVFCNGFVMVTCRHYTVRYCLLLKIMLHQ